MEKRKLNFMTGYITYISPEIEVNNVGRPMYLKRMVTVVSNDGQKFFGEIRKNKLTLLDSINTRQELKIGYLFEGSERDNKKYNNIYIDTLENV